MQLVIPAAGAAIGFFAGGPQGAAIGWAVGSTISSVLFQPDGIDGPRVKDLGYSGSSYGIPVARVWGTAAVSGAYIWAPDITENESEEGGKGPSYTTYSYTGSFAVIFCEGPVSGIRRLWFDTELVYDAQDDNAGYMFNEKLADRLNIHLGTSTQTADSVIESVEGAGNVPGYRGYCYITCEDIPLGDYGNKLPASIRAEIVKDDTDANTEIPIGSGSGIAAYSDADNYIYQKNWDGLSPNGLYWEKIDTDTNDVVLQSPKYYGIYDPSVSQEATDIDPDTNILYTWEWSPDASHFEPVSYNLNSWDKTFGVRYSGSATECGATLGSEDEPLDPYETPYFAAPKQVRVLSDWVGYCLSVVGSDGLYLATKSLNCNYLWYPTDYSVNDCAEDSDGNIWYICQGSGSPNANILGIVNVGEWDLNELFGIVSPTGLMWHVPTQSMIIDTNAGDSGMHRISFDLFSSPQLVLEASSVGDIGYFLNWHKRPIVGDTFWIYAGASNFREVSAYDLSSVRTEDPGSVSAAQRIYDPLSNAIWHIVSGDLRKFYLDRIPDGGQALSTVVSEIASDLGDRIDVSDLNQTVRGFLMTRPEQNREAIRRLMQSHLFDAAEVDGEVKFIELDSGSTAVSIPEVDLAAHNYGAETPAQTSIERTQEMTFPKRTEVIAFSRELEYEPTSQGAGRQIAKTSGSVKLELAEVLTDDQCAQLAEVLLHVPRIERHVHKFYLANEYLYLHPLDRVDITKDSTTHHVRITEMDWTGGILSCTAVSTDTASYTSTATGAANDGFIPSDLGAVKPTTPWLLDIPLLLNADDHPGFYAGFTSPTVSWGGATLYRSPDVSSLDYDLMKSASRECAAGYTTEALGDTTNTFSFDNTNTLTVSIIDGALVSSTDEAVISGANAIALSNGEIIQFVNATVNSPDTTTTLSRLLRGRRGTEHLTGTHTSGESWVLLTQPTIYDVATDLSTNGLPFYYRSPTLGQSVDNAVAHLFTNTNVRLKPFSGVEPQVSFDGSDVTLSWTRRTRLLTSPDYAAIPLGEESESYQIDIRADGSDTVLRTLTSTTPTVTYTSEQITEDFGTRPNYFDVDVYQMSASVGRGIPLTFSTAVQGFPFPIYTDFSEYTTDADIETADWTDCGTTGEGTVRAEAGAVGGKYLSYTTRLNTASGLYWDKSLNFDDVEILVHFKKINVTGNQYPGVIARFSGAAGTANTSYIAALDSSGNGRLWYDPPGSVIWSQIGSTVSLGLDVSSSPLPETWYRFRVIDTQLQAKWWQGSFGAEPADWQITETHLLLTTGRCGIYGYKHGGTTSNVYYQVDEFAVAYAGETAVFS